MFLHDLGEPSSFPTTEYLATALFYSHCQMFCAYLQKIAITNAEFYNNVLWALLTKTYQQDVIKLMKRLQDSFFSSASRQSMASLHCVVEGVVFSPYKHFFPPPFWSCHFVQHRLSSWVQVVSSPVLWLFTAASVAQYHLKVSKHTAGALSVRKLNSASCYVSAR